MKEIKACWKYAASIPTEHQLSGVHGISHWKRVERFGLSMAKSNPDIDTTVISLFACFHDFKRTDNGRNFTHGPSAADALADLRISLLAFLSDSQFAQLSQACREHTERTSPSGDITIDTCIDSDRLDLTRVSITPDPNQMLTPKGRELAAQIASDNNPNNPSDYNGNIIQYVAERLLPLCNNAETATQRINIAVHEAELRNIDALKMFVISSYASLPNPDIQNDPLIYNWFTNDEVAELQHSLNDHINKVATQDPFATILNEVFKD